MSTVSIKELQQDADALVNRVVSGEHLVIERGGHPVAELRAIQPPPNRTPRPYGLCAGEITIPDDFDAPLPEEVLRAFEGG